jgi:nucleoid-associated protein YgaU
LSFSGFRQELKRSAESGALVPAASGGAPAPAAATRTYTVRPGDSLSKIAAAQLGSGNRWPEIHNLNKDQVADPNLIYPGQVLRLP